MSLKRLLASSLLSVAVLCFLTSTNSAIAIPMDFTLDVEGIVTNNSFTPAVDAAIGQPPSTIGVGDAYRMEIEFLQDPNIFLGDLNVDVTAGDLITHWAMFDSSNTVIATDGAVFTEWELITPTPNPTFLRIGTLSGPNDFDLTLILDPSTFLGSMKVNCVFFDACPLRTAPFINPNIQGSATSLSIFIPTTGERIALPVPEPGTALLMGLGLIALSVRNRREV
jgi:hypothetical protein